MSKERNVKNILLTGRPGVGKTTVIMETIKLLEIGAVGFYTAEIRENNKRVGFEVISIEDNKSSILAHIDFPKSYKVGKYGVKPEKLESYLEEINTSIKGEKEVCLVIDEIGKMEFYTRGFKDTVLKSLDSSRPFLASIMKGKNKFCDSLKKRSDVELIEVTTENRDVLPERITSLLSLNLQE